MHSCVSCKFSCFSCCLHVKLLISFLSPPSSCSASRILSHIKILFANEYSVCESLIPCHIRRGKESSLTREYMAAGCRNRRRIFEEERKRDACAEVSKVYTQRSHQGPDPRVGNERIVRKKNSGKELERKGITWRRKTRSHTYPIFMEEMNYFGDDFHDLRSLSLTESNIQDSIQ